MINIRPIIFSVFAVIFCLWQSDTAAQAPNLPAKGTLSQTLLSSRTFANGTQVDTAVKRQPLSGDYTLEVVAKVNSATGRGLDIEARNSSLKGFRLSLDAASLKYTTPLTSAQTLSASKAGESQTIRIAVRNDSAHIYQNGAYLQTQPVSTIKDIANGAETDQLSDTATGPNLVANWAGTLPNTGKPSDYGWLLNPASTTLFAAANSTTAGTSRYLDLNASSGGNLHTLNGATYVGRVLYVRWDNSAIANTVYSYPVTLDSNTTYDFSMLFAYVSNGTVGSSLTVGIGTTTATSGRIATKTFTTSGTRALKKDDFYFTAPTSGTYYLTITGPTALYSIGELSVRKVVTNPRFIFGKNYPSGAVDMEISSATYEDGAYAPASIVTMPKQTVTLTGSVVQVPTTFNTDFIVPGKTDVHLTGEYTPFANSTVALNSDDAWLFFDNLKPSVVISNWLSNITINGVSAAGNPNVRVAIYKNGAVVIPNGNQTSTQALEAFTQPNLGGASKTFEIVTFHNNLAEFNNKIRSFRLKRGYMATFANNPDGSGYSRVFVANDSDLVVNAMPQGLDTTVSFIRVFKWDWVSKKGKAGWDPNKLNGTWYYDWNIGGSSSSNVNYVAIRQNGGWPAWSDINNKPNVNHVSGFNEPDQTNQSNLTVDEAVSMWPDYMRSGYRIGSPSPANPESSWITNFLAKTDSLNYRVDYVTIHCYWGGQTPSQWYSRLKAIYDRVKRPLWITEWNNGANWTTESWPTDQTAQFEKQLNDLKGILQVLDTASFVERYAIYEWVETKRMMVLADTLTPAGKYYAADKSDFAYNPAKAFVHTWKLVSPKISSSLNNGDYRKTTLSWNDLNGELGSKYVLERKINGRDADFVAIQDYTGYTPGGSMTIVDSVYSKASYRIRAIGLDGTTFVYGSTLDVIADNPPLAPSSLTGNPLSATKIRLNWNAGTNVRSYNLKRSLSATGPFTTVILPRTTALTFLDENLTPATTYYYTVTTLNSAGESDTSKVLAVTTPALIAPAGVVNPRVASGDNKLTLTWDFIFDARYYILRSETQSGIYDTIARNVDALRYVDSNRTNGVTYYYKIVAYNEIGTSPASSVLSGKPVSGQYLYISFNETSGTFAEDVWGGYHGTLAATATRDTSNNNTRSLKLDGTANAYATLGQDVVASLNDFTIATWVKMDAISTWMRIFDFGTGTNTYMFLTPQASVSNGISTIRYGIKNGSTEYQANYAYTWPLNTWTHIVVTQSANTVRLYVNGALASTTTGITLKPSDLGSTNQNYIGKSQWPDPMLRGSIDEFKIYNFAMSDQNINNLYLGNQLVLPVLLTAFDGKATSAGNLLNWHTSSEINNDYFVVERSVGSPSGFEDIAIVDGKGTTPLPNDYNYLDESFKPGVYYYRLRQVNFDGIATHSKIISVENTNKPKLQIYPNPVSSVATIQLPVMTTSKLLVRVFNTKGQQVFERVESATQPGRLQINLGKLSAGAYQVQVLNGTDRYIIPVIKQ